MKEFIAGAWGHLLTLTLMCPSIYQLPLLLSWLRSHRLLPLPFNCLPAFILSSPFPPAKKLLDPQAQL